MTSVTRVAATGLMTLGLTAAAYHAGRFSVVTAQSPTATVGAQAASPYPSDIDPESRNRLPVVKRDDLNDVGKALFDKTVEDFRTGRSLAGFQGPNGIVLHSPGLAEGDRRRADYLRFESRLGRRLYEVAILVTARELNQQFEWTAHEPAALAAGVERAVIDAIKFRRPLTGLQAKDAVLIRLGREVIRMHAVQSSTMAEALRLFTRQDLVDAVSVMGHYAGYAILLDAFDQQLAPGQTPLLPG
jgi:4-carboxymuconolactone decarboxylase